ncbi:hypothetical protein FAIPA1_360049 [Frankia sp. AiPs1]
MPGAIAGTVRQEEIWDVDTARRYDTPGVVRQWAAPALVVGVAAGERAEVVVTDLGEYLGVSVFCRAWRAAHAAW